MGIWFFAFVFLELGQRMKEIYHMASCWYPYDSLQYLHLNFYSPDFCPLKYLIFNCCLNTEDMWQTEFYWSALVVVDTSLATPPCFFFLYPPPASFFLSHFSPFPYFFNTATSSSSLPVSYLSSSSACKQYFACSFLSLLLGNGKKQFPSPRLTCVLLHCSSYSCETK